MQASFESGARRASIAQLLEEGRKQILLNLSGLVYLDSTGIGDLTALNLNATNVNATSTNGNLVLNNNLATAVTVTNLSTGTGTVTFNQTGNGAVTFTTVTKPVRPMRRKSGTWLRSLPSTQAVRWKGCAAMVSGELQPVGLG